MSRCKTNDKHNTKHFSDEEILKREKALMECYSKHNGNTLKIFFGLFKGDYFRLFLASLFYIVKCSPSWVIPLITADVINIAIYRPANALVQLIVDAVIALVVLVQNIPTHSLYVRFFSIAKRNMEAGLRGAMIRKLQQLSMGFLKETQSGALQSKIMRDVEAVESFASSMIELALNVSINMSITLVVVVNKSWPVFFMLLVCVPIAALVTQKFKKPIGERNRAFRKEIEHASSDVMEMIEMVPVTRAHSLESVEIRKLTSEITNVAERGFRLDKIQSLFGSTTWVLFNLFQLICLFFTGFLAFRGVITEVGDITLYQTYFTSLLGYVSSMISLLPVFSRGAEAISSIGEILNAYDVEDNAGKERLSTLRGEYEFRNVVFQYDDESPVLNGLDLKVKAGETIALVGESGAGKSTVLNLVIGFNKINGGKILVDGKDIDTLNLRSYRKYLSVVPQKTILFSGSIRENITYGSPRISEKKLWEVIDAANLRSVIEKLPQGLDTQVGEHGDKLSGGQRQRIAIARAIIRNPRVIIFDEATSALDSVSEREIQQAIDNLTRDRTTFIVAHRLSTIRNADKIAVIGNGGCMEYGTYDELMEKQGAFYQLKQMQS